MRSAHPRLLLLGVLAALALPGGAVAATRDRTTTPAEPPLSMGFTNAGKLVGGRQFRETSFIAHVQAHSKSKVSWALPNLLSVLNRAARLVARKYPGSILELGELSRKDGGRITSHLSHQSGRDADVSFYMTDLDGAAVRPPKFLRFDGKGEGKDDPTVRFDDKRNWEFVRAVLEDPNEEVRQIFIYAPLRARLLAYAAKVHAPHKLRAKAAAAMMQPVNALPHDDHFHIRISCPSDQLERGCADLPMWRAPGSPDDFDAELLADGPRQTWSTPMNGIPLETWGGMAKLWSTERAVCDAGGKACTGGAELVCTEGDASLVASFPRAIFEPLPVVNAVASNTRRSAVGPVATPADEMTASTAALVAAGLSPEALSGEGEGVEHAGEGIALGEDGPLRVPNVLGVERAGLGMPSAVEPAASPAASFDEPNACELPMAVLEPDAPIDSWRDVLSGPSRIE